MAKNKNTQPAREKSGKGSLNEAKTNEDFNKKQPKQDDPMLKVKTVKK